MPREALTINDAHHLHPIPADSEAACIWNRAQVDQISGAGQNLLRVGNPWDEHPKDDWFLHSLEVGTP